MSLLDPRPFYKPFEYPHANELFQLAVQSFWVWTEVSMSGDVSDLHSACSPGERSAVINVLRLFTQLEVNIEEYWSQKVARWFPKPEIQQMANIFAGFEAIHISAYSYLNDSFGLSHDEYKSFLNDASMKAKIDRLSALLNKEETLEDIARSLAVFSAFTEGVALFSSFAILLNFGRFSRLKGVGQIIRWSIRDESLHSNAGCWLFRELVSEHPELLTDDFKKSIYQAARDTVELEDAYIDRVFEGGGVEGLTSKQLKTFVRHRANTKLGDLGLKMNWKNLDKAEIESVTSWFDVMSAGTEHTDFFAQRSTSYSRGHIDWSRIWESP